jgi:PAS domain S-box-containing protein
MKDITSAHKAEERYALAVTAGQVGLWNWNLQTCEIYFNPSWKAMLGYTDREIPNHQAAWLRLIYPDDREWVMTSANIHIEGLTPQFEIEHRMLHKNGSARWFLCRGMAFRDETGKPYRMAGSTTDITERKRTEEALQESEYRYYTLAKMSPVGIFHTDAEGNCLYVNERWRELTGLTLAEALGQGWIKAIHPDDRSRLLVEWHQAMVGNCTFASEYRFRRSDGVVTWVFGQAVPEKGLGDNIVGFIGTITDITDRKATEEALRLQCFRERLIGSMLERIRQSLDLGEILNTTVAEVRQFLECDRVLVHRFQPDWTGVITVESQDPKWTPILGTCIADSCFSENYVHLYQHGRIQAVTDIYTSGLSQCHINLLERFQVRANLVVPILQKGFKPWEILVILNLHTPHCGGCWLLISVAIPDSGNLGKSICLNRFRRKWEWQFNKRNSINNCKPLIFSYSALLL